MPGNGGGRRKRTAAAKSASFNTRITPELRGKLDQAAAGSNRSLSDEIEERLARSFAFEDEALKSFGSRQDYAVCRLLADLMRKLSVATGRSWREDPWTHEQLKIGIVRLLAALRPEGEAVQPAMKYHAPETAAKLGEQLAGYMLAALDHGVDILAAGPEDPYAAIRDDLGLKTSDQRS